MKDHAWFKRNWIRCSEKEIEYGLNWIIAHDHLNVHDFQAACNRMALDNPELRKSMKNFERVQEMVSNSNVEVK
jgi:hypothetical protein